MDAAEQTAAAWNDNVPVGTPVRFQGDALPNYRTSGPARNRGGVAVVECVGIPPAAVFDGPCPVADLTAMPDWDTGE